MNIEVLPDDMDRSHCIGNPKTKKKERSIIFKVIRHNQKNNILKNMKFAEIKVCQSASRNQITNGKTKQSLRNLWFQEFLD